MTTYICIECKKVFEGRRSRKKRFCSMSCRATYLNRENPNYGFKKGHISNNNHQIRAICEKCGRVFYRQPALFRRGGKYCSLACSHADRNTKVIKECPLCHKEFTDKRSHIDKRKYCSPGCRRLSQSKRLTPTGIEEKLYLELEKKGLIFEKQKLVNEKFVVDAYIPMFNLIIEADGNYLHSLPATINKDNRENSYLRKCGYKLLRLTEDEINNGSFKERLVNYFG